MFTTDSRAENWLTYNGCKFTYEDSVKYSELHEKWRENNLGRPKDMDPEAILDYGCRMEAGSPAPAVILMPAKGGYIVLDGVQRLSAAENLSATTFAAYVLNPRTSLSKQHLVRCTASSQINGQHTPEKEWILSSTVRLLYFTDHCSPEEIARGCGRTVEKVKEEIRYQRTSDMMQSVGYDAGGPLLGNRKRWLVAKIGNLADVTDWQAAPGPMREFLHTVEKCNFRNGDADEPMEAFFQINRSAKKNRHVQLTNRLNEFKKNPEVKTRLGRAGKKKHHMDDVLPSLRRTATTLERAVSNQEQVQDQDFADTIAEVLRGIYVSCRQLVPRDLQYAGNRRSSIFDKG
jgi:hypothetical protein